MTVEDTFTVQYAVPMTCESCVEDIKTSLGALQGITDVTVDLPTKMVAVTGSVLPSAITATLQGAGRDAIVRGTGAPNSAAVAILEDVDGRVQGLVRIVQAGLSTIFDISVSPEYLGSSSLYPSVNSYGDISGGAKTTGAPVYDLAPFQSATSSDRAPVAVSALIGRSFVINPDSVATSPRSLAGVIARSAGLWENDKQVCSCSGQTLWQERAAVKAQGRI